MVLFLLAPLASCAGSIATACACTACSCISREAMNRSARLAYSLLFLFSMLLAWALRDFAKPILTKIPWIMHSFSSLPPDAWFGAQAVYRVSLGNFVLFSTLSAVMVGVRTRDDPRDVRLHHGPASFKLGLWLASMVAPFFLPNGAIVAYSWLARVVSPLFLLLQMVILVDATHAWNDAWVDAGEDDERWLYGLLAATLGCYGGVVAVLALSAHWFVPSWGDCGTNAAVLALAASLAVAVSLASLHPKVAAGSLFPASAVSLYVAYLSYSAMLSEPRDEECNLLGHRLSAASGTSLAAGMAATLLSVVWSAFRAGSNGSTFDFQGGASSAGGGARGNANGRDALSSPSRPLLRAPSFSRPAPEPAFGYQSLPNLPDVPTGLAADGNARARATDANEGARANATARPEVAEATPGRGRGGARGRSAVAASSSSSSSYASSTIAGARMLPPEDLEASRNLSADEVRARVAMDAEVDGAAPGALGASGAASGAPVDARPVGYSYAQFYLVFALASAYMGMLMTGWGSGITQRDVIDVGWVSVYVKVGTACTAALLYLWTLVAPALFPDRVFA